MKSLSTSLSLSDSLRIKISLLFFISFDLNLFFVVVAVVFVDLSVLHHFCLWRFNLFVKQMNYSE